MPGCEGNLGQMKLYIISGEPNPVQFRIDFGTGSPFNQVSIPSASGTVMPNQYTMVNVPPIVELSSTGGENGHLTVWSTDRMETYLCMLYMMIRNHLMVGWYFHKRIIQVSHGTDMSHFLHYLMLVIYLLETLSLLYQSVMIKLHLHH